MTDPVVWFNQECSKCRTTHGILSERGVDATYVDYRAEPPTIDELRAVLSMIGTTSAATIARTGDAGWSELGVDETDDEAVLAALAANPVFIQRPIVIVGDRAVVARPPERVLELLDPAPID